MYTTITGGVVKPILGLCCSLLVAGCAIRPLPEHVTGVTTYNIVRQIRCETRQAVFETFIDAMIKNPDTFNESAQRIALQFQDDPASMYKLNPTLFTGSAKEFFQFFWKTGVAYNFTLDMTETNNLDAQIDLLRMLTAQNQTFGFKAGVDRDRQNTRVFTLTDDFAGLLDVHPRDYCDGHLAAENPIYPMTGKIGIEPFIKEFVRLSLFTNLGSQDGGPPTMVDTLAFTTTVSGSAVPMVTFSPVGTSLNVADASLTADVIRKDVHTLIMGLSVVSGIPSPSPARTKVLVGNLLTASGGGTRQSAANAVDQELTKQALSKTIVIRR
jgi:hypothetical protein